MTELQELTYNKDFDQLQKELYFQIDKMKEPVGGAVCSAVIEKIEHLLSLEKDDTIEALYLDYFNNYLSVERFAFDHGFHLITANVVISKGRRINHKR